MLQTLPLLGWRGFPRGTNFAANVAVGLCVLLLPALAHAQASDERGPAAELLVEDPELLVEETEPPRRDSEENRDPPPVEGSAQPAEPTTSPADLGTSPLPPLPRSPTSHLDGEAVVPDQELFRLLDTVLPEAAQDLSMDVAHWELTSAMPTDEMQLLKQATTGWAISSRLYARRGRLSLRLTAAEPGRRTLLVREEFVTADNLEVRALSMLRDLSGHAPKDKPSRPARRAGDSAEAHRSDGKAVLAVTGALTGAYVGFAVEHVGGSNDVTLIYPLMTLGAGMGVGVSMVVAEEWNIDVSEAWYLAAAAGWPTTAAILIADGQDPSERSNRYGYGLAGTAAGLALGTAGLAAGTIDQGDAVLTHSGALFGMLYGGLTEMFITADTGLSPSTGLGVGMAVGVLAAGAWATQESPVPESQVLFVDLGAVLGGLAGAALASPALVGDQASDAENRIWLASVGAGTVLGGVVGYAFTQNHETADDDEREVDVIPYVTQVDLGQPELTQATAFGMRLVW